VATITGQRAGSVLPPPDTPSSAEAFSAKSHADETAQSARSAWRSVTPLLAGTLHVRISRDGGRTYPARHAGPLPADPPEAYPCTIPVYDAGAAAGRLLVPDLDPGRGDVEHQAAELGQLLGRLGARYVADVAPSGGRHVYVLFGSPLPWLELRDLVRAMALRFPAIDTAPMSGLGGQISPPGSRHRSGGRRQLSMPLEDARAAVERPNGPEVWDRLLTEFAAELLQIEQGAHHLVDDQMVTEPDDSGVLWLPRLGGRARLSPELEAIARTGRWDRSRYAGRSEARMAVVTAAAARGWRLDDVREAIGTGAWHGLAGLYERRSEPRRLERLLPYEWRKSVDKISQEKNVRHRHTSDLNHAPPAAGIGVDQYRLIRQWMTMILCAAEDPERVRGWGRRAIAIRLVLLALGQAAMASGSSTIELGCC
jgi:hypothetical protein